MFKSTLNLYDSIFKVFVVNNSSVLMQMRQWLISRFMVLKKFIEKTTRLITTKTLVTATLQRLMI